MQLNIFSGNIKEKDSVFNYQNGKSWNSFNHLDFKPIFLDDFSPSLIKTASNMCGNQNKACIYDFLATQDRSFAKETQQLNQDNQDSIKTISK